MQSKALDLPPEVGHAAKILVLGATKRQLASQYCLVMPKITSSTILLDEMAATVAADLSAALTSVLGQQVLIWLTALPV